MSEAGCSDNGICGNEGAVAIINAVRNIGTICVEQAYTASVLLHQSRVLVLLQVKK